MVEKERELSERERNLEGKMEVVRWERRGVGLRRGFGDGMGMEMAMREEGGEMVRREMIKGEMEVEIKGSKGESRLEGSVLRSESNILEKERILEERMIEGKEKGEKRKEKRERRKAERKRA
ncbi:predicted protein [Sclerotinia sclerotiorum 1980 UF-70]|uniref:Uncharacterized protein n=1 Tax=Sclerotinia sclerotiorum (strain ATCC 18683 / 1980 / Ss-1) TaxID=665079 RepID=A7EK79_SCLS1|nr:predicted protein [Sclerotinia sclerotiorum 1980 UF-70]EDO03245.1 predicted protein [Sclerotinia sclerotiorum 1980 UF-70]